MCGFYKPFFLLLLLIMVNACGGNDAAVNDRATPDPTLPTPVPLLAKEPLAGDVAAIPEVLIVGAGQSRARLAATLKTTDENLVRVNPRLPDPVPPGTLVVIPVDLHVDGGTLASVAAATGLTVESLAEYNPDLTVDQLLAADTVLVMPTLVLVQQTMARSAVATQLQVDEQVLLAANPGLSDEIARGTLLVVPPEKSESE